MSIEDKKVQKERGNTSQKETTKAPFGQRRVNAPARPHEDAGQRRVSRPAPGEDRGQKRVNRPPKSGKKGK